MGLWLHFSRRLVWGGWGPCREHRALKVDQPDRVTLLSIHGNKPDVRMCVFFPLRDDVVLLSAVKIAAKPKNRITGASRSILWNVNPCSRRSLNTCSLFNTKPSGRTSI